MFYRLSQVELFSILTPEFFFALFLGLVIIFKEFISSFYFLYLIQGLWVFGSVLKKFPILILACF